MVDAVGEPPNQNAIVELGPGTGSFTQHLAATWPQHRLIAIERNARFAALVRKQFPQIDLHEGCASEVDQVLADLAIPRNNLHAIMCGLPLLSLPKEVRTRILQAVWRALEPGKQFVMFTYSAKALLRLDVPGFELTNKTYVPINLPPANVLTWTRLADEQIGTADNQVLSTKEPMCVS